MSIIHTLTFSEEELGYLTVNGSLTYKAYIYRDELQLEVFWDTLTLTHLKGYGGEDGLIKGFDQHDLKELNSRLLRLINKQIDALDLDDQDKNPIDPQDNGMEDT